MIVIQFNMFPLTHLSQSNAHACQSKQSALFLICIPRHDKFPLQHSQELLDLLGVLGIVVIHHNPGIQ